MDTKAPNLIPSGVEPVDKLMGGLQSGQSYLVHGEASGKSLFGIKFLIEGLKRGENGALVIRYSPEDAVRRFARLGYDCLEDVYSGRLVILEYSDDIIQQIARLRELTPVLRELEWLLGETRPQRIIFDPFTNLVAGEGNIESRAREFTDWTRSFGATVIFIANGDGEVVEAIKPHAAEVFRFEVKEVADRAMRFIVFEKSPAIPDQAIEVDPSRGIFLHERARSPEQFFSMFQATPSSAESSAADETNPPAEERAASESTVEVPAEPAQDSFASPAPDQLIEPSAGEQLAAEAPRAGVHGEAGPPFPGILATDDAPVSKETLSQKPAPVTESHRRATTRFTPAKTRVVEPPAETTSLSPDDRASLTKAQSDALSELVDELANSTAPLDLDLPELEPASSFGGGQTIPAPPAIIEQATQISEPQADLESAGEILSASEPADIQASHVTTVEAPAERRHSRAADLKIDSVIAQRAAEILLRPPDTSAEPVVAQKAERRAALADAPASASIHAKDFNVLIIQDDPVAREVIAHTLSDYTIELVNDGISALARLISMKPDLVVLDLDLPIIDGFKVLEHIRSSLNMPIIIVSGSHIRATDRVRAAELGADYYLTKPFSVVELRHKARQLIARYRGINSWILSSKAGAHSDRSQPPAGEAETTAISEPVVLTLGPQGEQFLPYQDFASRVEERVMMAADKDVAFSIVGCRLAQMTANGGQSALRLYEMVRALVRDTDLISTNPRNDLVILLTDANAGGAHAFVNRLRERVLNELNQEPSIWLRSFPDLEEDNEATASALNVTNGSRSKRRATDKQSAGMATVERRAGAAQRQTASTSARADIQNTPDPRQSYIDFLEQL
ncbi:MAG TPA: response regulator [Blastocatellia bacterium]|nr:response regulator [Blastocatellia bacterium]